MGKLKTALDDETKERKDDKQAFQQQLGLLADLLTDNNTTTGYTIQYLNDLNAQCNAKALMLQQSIRVFNEEFLKLPPKSNRYVAIWDAAWVIVATTVPALRLMPALAKVEKAAAIEMATAKAFMKTPKLVARITIATVKRHNIADVIVKANNIRDKVNKATGIHTSVPVDKSKTPVKEMIKEADDARKVLNSAIDALDREFAARLFSVLYEVPYTTNETLSDMATRLLPPLPYYTDDDLEQIGRFYLWNILGHYAKDNVKIVTTAYRTGDSQSISGLNDSQQDQIMEWFGLQSNWQGGRVPVIPIFNVALSYWNVGRLKESAGGSIFGYN